MGNEKKPFDLNWAAFTVALFIASGALLVVGAFQIHPGLGLMVVGAGLLEAALRRSSELSRAIAKEQAKKDFDAVLADLESKLVRPPHEEKKEKVN